MLGEDEKYSKKAKYYKNQLYKRYKRAMKISASPLDFVKEGSCAQ